ncbi:MAG: hypothetical protein COS85_06875 [Armatimonadetes bacterium CG07_land_8_20_14_0_80_59_28]|nr:MAG: hypothetical protein COS85_06875 [Armatimonadetes bacterium CG07_land_8_20_14_0_80_59_28]
MPKKNDESLGLQLMMQSLNNLYDRYQKRMPKATPREVEDAMYAYLRRCEKARNALGKDWMKWFPPDSDRKRYAE